MGVFGFFYYPQLLEVQALRGMLSAGVLYICTPKSLLIRKPIEKMNEHSGTIQEQLQQMLRQQLQEYARAFQRIGQNFGTPAPAYAAEVELAADWKKEHPEREHEPKPEPVFARQLVELGNSLEEFSDGVSTVVPISQRQQNALLHRFEKEHVRIKDMVMVKGLYGRRELYVSARTIRGRVMTTKEAAGLISRELGTGYRVSTGSRMIINQDYDVIVFEEDTRYHYLTGAARRRKDGQMVSGDSFSQMELRNGQLLMVLADGMGCGMDASEQSEQLVDLLEEMLEAGFKKETAIHILNELLTVKSQGETFATLDLCMLDLYTGVGEFLKMGASATFIRRGDWIETIQSTSLPVGVTEQTEIDAIQKKFYHGDMIVMVSDGLLDGIIFENKEECLKELLLDIKTNNPQELAEELMERVRRMNTRGMRDDASILVLGLWKK
jgi:stage II sporulation protein E